ncbi:MAG: V-type ATPase subunit [Candidatus Thorarchaeota archaeon]
MSYRTANEYAFVNARIRGLKSRLLGVGDYERLMQSASYEDFIKTLMGTAYGPIISREHFVGVPYPDELALILSRHFAEVSHSITRTLTGRVRMFAESYMNMFLAESIKSIIRGLHVGLDREEILRFAVPASPEQEELFDRLVDTGSVDAVIDDLPYMDMRLALLTRVHAYEKYNSTAPLEVALEEWLLGTVSKVLAEFPLKERARVLSLLEARVVLRNTLTVLRALHLALDEEILNLSLIQFTGPTDAVTDAIRGRTSWREVFSTLESTKYADIAGRLARIYGEQHNLADVELAIEDYLAQKTKQQLVAFPFHLGAVFGLFGLKYYEIRNIRSIAVGIERGESPEMIRRVITIF